MSDEYEERARAWLRATYSHTPPDNAYELFPAMFCVDQLAGLLREQDEAVGAGIRKLMAEHAAERDQLRAEVERLTRERDEACKNAATFCGDLNELRSAFEGEVERVERLRAEVRRAREMRDLLRVADVPGWRVSAEGMRAGWDAWVAASDALHPGDLGEEEPPKRPGRRGCCLASAIPGAAHSIDCQFRSMREELRSLNNRGEEPSDG